MGFCDFTFILEACWISAFAMLGVLVRLWLGKLFELMQVTSESTALFHDLPANAMGCFLMGFLTSRDSLLKQLHPTVHIGTSTGFLGSFTTFASWNLSVADLFIMGQVASGFVALVIGTQTALVSWVMGSQLAAVVEYWFPERVPEDDEEIVPFLKSHHLAYIGLPLLGILFIGFSILVWQDDGRNRDEVWIATLLAPVGALGRWQLARLNKRGGWFFWGTYAANMLAISIDVVVESVIVAEETANLVLLAIPTGIAGCLSTVRTAILRRKPRKIFVLSEHGIFLP
uniref:Fluoride ion transporter CrcB n=2 Tax=Rhodosorus marinus TaxID=101924 RepID=A0A7S2ZPV8_9RHOD|mmetsp:Transcript_27784/g.109010  ORF Transcript_27784/g.109010 Transcript_27784/m.109010 type:complete len:286 (+) Transcript_27784:338-1195(+)